MIFETTGAGETKELGRRIGALLRAGDLVLLNGTLGAGKTTFTQGVAEGMKVEGRVTSPTFIVSRVHDAQGDGPPLVHVDAYRIDDANDLETLDLDTSLPDSVTVIEWGADKVEVLSETRLEISFATPSNLGSSDANDWQGTGDEVRLITVEAIGGDWAGRLAALAREDSDA